MLDLTFNFMACTYRPNPFPVLVGVTKFGPGGPSFAKTLESLTSSGRPRMPRTSSRARPFTCRPLSVAMLEKSEKAKVVQRASHILEGLKKFGRE